MIALSRRFDAHELRELRERTIFEAGKLDPQYHDHPAVAPFALRIAPSDWRALERLAESAAVELLEAEAVLHRERRHWRRLGVDRRLRDLLASVGSSVSGDVRVFRFDFHPTAAGWRLSEVNADVPGGFVEAGPVTRVVASYFRGLGCPADPGRALAVALASRIREGDVALVHATSYSDDQQVMRLIRDELARLGIQAHFAAPDHIRAQSSGRCTLSTNGARIDAVVRFFPGEWIRNLRAGDRAQWARLGGSVVHANPLTALLVQSKRLPLVLSRLAIPMPTWNRVLPPARALGWRCVAPRLVPTGWVLKPAWGRVGEGVCVDGVTEARAARPSIRHARCFPQDWVLQQRFDSQAIDGVHVCLGVYVVDGKASGAYARVAPRPLIDGRAQDAAVLLDPALDAPEERAQHVA